MTFGYRQDDRKDQITVCLDQSKERRKEVRQMLRWPESKNTQNILQTKVDAFWSNKNIDDRDNGHGRVITRKNQGATNTFWQ